MGASQVRYNGPPSMLVSLKRVVWSVLNCARRTNSPMLPPARSFLSLRNGLDYSPPMHVAQSSFTFPHVAMSELPHGPSLRTSDIPSLLTFLLKGRHGRSSPARVVTPFHLSPFFHKGSGQMVLYCAHPIFRTYRFPPRGGLVDPPLRASNDIINASKLARSPFKDGG